MTMHHESLLKLFSLVDRTGGGTNMLYATVEMMKANSIHSSTLKPQNTSYDVRQPTIT